MSLNSDTKLCEKCSLFCTTCYSNQEIQCPFCYYGLITVNNYIYAHNTTLYSSFYLNLITPFISMLY